MLCQSYKIDNFVAVAGEIIKLFRGLCLPEGTLNGIEFAIVMHLLPDSRGRSLPHVGQMLRIDFIGAKIADIDKTAVSDGAHAVVSLIHTTAKSVEKGLRWLRKCSEEGVPLHGWGGLNAR